MEAIDRIIKFDALLLKAFDKMVRDIHIELNAKGKESLKGYCNDRWWYIQSISNDSINICSTTHFITTVSLDEVKF